MKATAPPASLAFVYDGRDCLGFILARGKLGFEAMDRDERSLGLFQTQREAATAIMRGNHERPRRLRIRKQKNARTHECAGQF